MKPAAAALVLLLAAGAATAQEAAKREGDTVAFELKSSVVFVKATVNGVEGTFIVDTGASVTVINPKSAEKFGLKVEKKSGGIFGAPNFVDVDSIGAGKALVRKLPVAVMAVPQADLPLSMQGIGYDGILGFNYISQFVTTFDYKKKTIGLVPNDFVPPHPMEALQAQLGAARGGAKAAAGFSYRSIGADEANEIGVEGGVVVKKLAKGGPAEAAGLKEGDIIQEIDGKRCDAAEDWQKALARAKPGDKMKLAVIRDKKDVTVEITLEARK